MWIVSYGRTFAGHCCVDLKTISYSGGCVFHNKNENPETALYMYLKFGDYWRTDRGRLYCGPILVFRLHVWLEIKDKQHREVFYTSDISFLNLEGWQIIIKWCTGKFVWRKNPGSFSDVLHEKNMYSVLIATLLVYMNL